MKRLNVIFSVILIAALLGGLCYKNVRERQKYEQTEFLFDTECTVTAYGREAKEAVKAAFDEISEIHRLTDMYDEKSDIAKINTAEAGAATAVDKHVTEILNAALEICRSSDGAFDITVAPVTEIWNFKDGDSPPQDEDINKALKYVGYGNIEVDTEKQTVTKKCKGIKIDLGGAAKGYAADAALKVVKKYDVYGALADLGGNISCMGENINTRDKKWRVGIQIPFSPAGEYGKIINLQAGAVVTSGTYQRNFEYGGKLYHHIINPSTGYPAEQDYNSVTVTADDALTADCLSTACFVLGRSKGKALAEKYGADIYYQ